MNNSWLFDNIEGLKEKIYFKDRTEYRVSGKLHNPYGPAVIYHSYGSITVNTDNCYEYWLKGEEYDIDEWKLYTRKIKINKIKNNLKN
jgi:hypothetical protein